LHHDLAHLLELLALLAAPLLFGDLLLECLKLSLMGADTVTQGWASSSILASRLAREGTDMLRWVHLLLLLVVGMVGLVLGLVEGDWRLSGGAVSAKCVWRHAVLQVLLLLLPGWEAGRGVGGMAVWVVRHCRCS
jgi:hypothetical protein